jgi:hypothetical protein
MIKINKREKILIYVIAGLVFLFLVERFLFSGIRGNSKGVAQKIKIEEARLQAGLDIQKRKDAITAEYNELKPYLSKSEGASDREIFAKFLKESERVAQDAGVSIVSLSPQDEPQSESGYVKYNADLRVEGSITKVLTLIDKIQNSELLIKVDKMNLSSKDEKAGSIKVEAVLSLVVPKS